MRIYEIINDNYYQKVREDCSLFLKYIGYNKKYIPLRDFRDYSKNLSKDISMVATRDIRQPLLMNKDETNILSIISDNLKMASRTKNCVITSSKGFNKIFNLLPDSTYYILPVGDFIYSYCKGDFNQSNQNNGNLTIRTIIRELINLIQFYVDRIIKDTNIPDEYTTNVEEHINLESVINEIMADKIHLVDYIKYIFNYTVKMTDDIPKEWYRIENYEEIIDNVSYYYKDQIEKYSLLFEEALKSIKTDDYKNAFTSEHEIWFNCKYYYAIKYEDDLDNILK